MKIRQIKEKVKSELETFVPDELKSIAFQDFGTAPWEIDAPGFPIAVVSSPGMVSELASNHSVMRTYNFNVYVVCDADEVKNDLSIVEDLLEKLMDHFDSAEISNAFNGYITPTAHGPAPIDAAHNKVMAMLSIKISTEKDCF